MTPKISVVLPLRDGRPYLAAAIESILAQTEPSFELIAVDDGSTDDSLALLQNYRSCDDRIRILRQPASGIVSALNRGLGEARGDYIARMDADDIAHPSRLEQQAALLDRRPRIGLVSSRVDYLGDRSQNQGLALFVDWTNTLLDPKAISLNRFVESPLIHPTALFRRELVVRYGGYRAGEFPEDYELWLRWLDAGVHIEKLDQSLLAWRDRPDRLTRRDPRYTTAAFFRAKAPYLARWLKANNPHQPHTLVWGAGRTTRLRLRPLFDLGVRVGAWIDIDPNKIGWSVNGSPVLSPAELPDPADCFVLAAVGKRDARGLISAELVSRGFELGQNYICCA